MIPLEQLLSIFNSVTIQRSRNYLHKIDIDTLDISHDDQYIEVYTQVEGSDFYDTFIVYDPKRQRISDTECSCPVGNKCKHAAALTQLFHKKYLNSSDHSTELNQIISPSNTHEKQALFWLNEFQQTLEKIDPIHPKQQTPLGQFIYVLQQNPQLTCTILKVKRGNSGEIKDAKTYNSYSNIISNKISLPQSEQQLFQKIYTYSTINHSGYYDQSKLTLQNIPRNDFKELIESQYCYWYDDKTQPLKWSDEEYLLDLQWQQNSQLHHEKLIISLVSPHGNRVSLPSQTHDFEILYTQPLCLHQKLTLTIHRINSIYPTTLLQKILAMPELPKDLVIKVDHILQQHQITQDIPKSISSHAIRHIHGDPIAILRFGGFNQLTPLMMNTHHQGLAEIYFEYPCGRIKANISGDHFFGKENNETVYQHRDLIQEQQRFQQLQQLLPSLDWANQHKALKHLKLQQTALIYADYEELVRSIIPENKIENLGWQIEHLPDSQFNLQQAKNIELSLLESESQQDWFNVGATVEDSTGKTYDLIELLAGLIQQNPLLIEPSKINNMDEDGFFTINLRNDQPNLALRIKEIKPILQHLGSIMQQNNPSLDRYDASQLLELEHHLGLSWLTSNHLKRFAEQFKQGSQQTRPTPQSFHGELRPYQQQGLGWLQFLRQTNHGGILADDMGLGKTAQTLAHLLMEKQAGHLQGRPALIIAPTSLMHNWFKEAKKFTPELKVLILQGQNRHQYFAQIPEFDIILSTYPLLARDEELLLQYEFHQLILDEAQNIKNAKAKAAHVARQIRAKHRLCLTGTPIENHLGELWSLFYFLMPGFLNKQEVFNKNYRYPIEKEGNQQCRDKLTNRIKPFILRRLKTDVAKELPPKTTIEINIDMNDQQSKLYEAVRATMQKNIRQIIADKGFKRSQIQILDALLKLRQVCCHPSLLKLDTIKNTQAHSAKLDQLLEMVTSMVEEGRKIIIFSQFTSMLQLIEDRLNIEKIKHVKLTGQTRKREEVIMAFQSGDIPVFLISLKAGGVGLNLTAADTVIHYDPWWNPAVEEQASDRAWRIGQDKPVFVYKLVTNQSIEEKIIALQKNKAQLAQSILSNDQESEIKLNEDDIMKLFDKF